MKLVKLTPLILFIFICGIHLSQQKKLYTNKNNYFKHGDCGEINHYKNGKVGSYMKWQIMAMKFDPKYSYFHLLCSKFNVGRKRYGKCIKSRLIVQNGKNKKKMRYCGYKYMLDKKFNANEKLMLKFNKMRGKKKMRDMLNCKICLKMKMKPPPPTTASMSTTIRTSTSTTTTTTTTTSTTTTTTTPTPPCDAGWTDHTDLKCYKAITTAAIYSNARTDCQGQGGDLVVLRSHSQFNLVRQLMTDNSITTAWLGATDNALEGTFVWVDGTNVGPVEGVDLFASGQPDDGGSLSTENCLATSFGFIMDESCTSGYEYVCMKDQNS